MDADSDEGWTHVPLSALDRQEEYRRVAALENASLEVQHESSRLQEQAIADELESLEAQRSSLEKSVDHGSEFPLTGMSTEMHIFGSENVSNSGYSPSSFQGDFQRGQPSSGHAAVEPIEGYSAANVFGLARSRLQIEGLKQFWETGFWNDFLDPNKDFFSGFEQSFKRPVDPTHVQDDGPLDDAVVRKPKTTKVAATFMDHVRTTTVMSWREQRESEWQTAIYSVQIVEQIFSREGFTAQAQVLVDIFHNRAPATIMKRCRSMSSRLTNYFIDRGRTFPCDESQFYEFMCVERENGAPPSRLKGFIEAVTFCRHVLGVLEFEGITSSRRCQGVAALDVSHKIHQAEPLSVKQLEILHNVLFNSEELWNRVFAGMLLFCVYARSRWSDAQHGEEFLEDYDETGNCAYIEIATGVHKTAKALQLRHLFLPLVAPCLGVVAGNWGSEWCDCRKKLGIHDLKHFPLMPAPNAAQEPTERPLSTTEAGSWMRDLLSVDVANKFVFHRTP